MTSPTPSAGPRPTDFAMIRKIAVDYVQILTDAELADFLAESRGPAGTPPTTDTAPAAPADASAAPGPTDYPDAWKNAGGVK